MLMEFVAFIPFSTYFSASKNPFMHPVLKEDCSLWMIVYAQSKKNVNKLTSKIECKPDKHAQSTWQST